MPLYEYECDACGERFEVIQKSFSSPPPEECEKCGKGPVHRLQSSPAIQFKGSGFYITDYAKKSTPEGGSGGSGSGGSKGKSDGGKSDSTSESKTDAKSETKSDSATPKESSAKSDAPAASASAASTTPTSTKKD